MATFQDRIPPRRSGRLLAPVAALALVGAVVAVAVGVARRKSHN